MRPQKNPLDLNNLPEDYTRDIGKQVLEDTSSSAGFRKKKNGGKDGKDENEKVYECRFCSLKFCKSQALGGHMNRHRQERETETLNRARQLVFTNDNLLGQGPPHHHHHHLGGQQIPPGGYHQTSNNIADPTLPFRSVYPTTRLFPSSSSSMLPPPPPPPPQTQPYIYTSPPRLVSYPSQYPPPPMNDYFVGHVLSGNAAGQYGMESNYTCIGAPVGHAFPSNVRGGNGGGGADGAVSSSQEEGLSWIRSYAAAAATAGGGGTRQHLDPPSINRFQDGF